MRKFCLLIGLLIIVPSVLGLGFSNNFSPDTNKISSIEYDSLIIAELSEMEEYEEFDEDRPIFEDWMLIELSVYHFL